MADTDKVVQSDRGSIRYLDGTFYDQYWVAVFTPLDSREYGRYLQSVNYIEKQVRRRLAHKELIELAKSMSA